MNGYLKLIIGPMFSGKTSSLIDIYNNIDNQSQAIVINHVSDNRYTDKNELISHDGTKIPCYNFNKIRDLYDLDPNFKNIKYVLINEAQFFDDLVKMVTILVEKYNINVYLAGLDGDFQKSKFGCILDLIPLSDEVIKLNAICKCGLPAPFSMRITDEKKQVSVGTNNYRPTCRKCHNF